MIYSVVNAPWKSLTFGSHGFPLNAIADALRQRRRAVWDQMLLDDFESECMALGFA